MSLSRKNTLNTQWNKKYMASINLTIFKNFTCVLFWNDVKVILLTIYMYMYVVHVFHCTNIYYSQCFDLFFASFFLFPNIKNWNFFFCSVFLTFFQIINLNWLFKVKLPIMVHWLFLFCVYFVVAVFLFVTCCFLSVWRLVFFIIH